LRRSLFVFSLLALTATSAIAQQTIYVFTRTGFPPVTLPSQPGQQVILGSFLIPPREFSSVNASFDVWASITLSGGVYNPGTIQTRLFLCDTVGCTGQINAELSQVQMPAPNSWPNGMNLRASFVVTTPGTQATAIGSQAAQLDGGGGSNEYGSPSWSSSNQVSQSFDSTRTLYLVTTFYLSSSGGQNGTPTAQLNAVRLNLLH
jgi:hypothetical protein